MADDEGEDFIIKVTTDIKQASQGLEGMLRHIGQVTAQGGERFGILDKAIGGVGSTVLKAVGSFNGWLRAAQVLIGALDQVLEFGGKLASTLGIDEKWEELTGAIGELQETASGALEELSNRALEFGDATQSSAADASVFANVLQRVTERAIESVRGIQAFFAQFEKLENRSESALKAQISSIRAQIDEAASQLSVAMSDTLIGQLNRALGGDGRLSRRIAELTAELGILESALASLQGQADQVDLTNIIVGDNEKAIQALREQNRELGVQIATFNMAAGAAARYRAERKLLAELGDEDGFPRVDADRLIAELNRIEASANRLEAMRTAKREAEREEQRARSLTERTDRIFTSAEGRVDQINAQTRALTLAAGASASLAAEERLLLQLRQAQIPVTDAMREQIAALAAAEGAATENLQHMKREMAAIQDTGRAFGTAMERAFGDWITGAETDWNRLFSSLARDIAVLTLRTQVLQPLFGGGAGGGTGLITSLLSGVLGLPGRASGGPVRAGQAYMVGERGPEPFIPDTDGWVMPNGAMGGGAIEMNMTINLEGANGDETIARIAGDAARRHAAAAVQQADASFPARQRRFQLLER